MNNQLIPIKSAAEFRLSELVKPDGELTRRQQAVLELFGCFDAIWHEFPPQLQDLVLRFFRSSGLPIAYPALPFWAERAALHFFTLCYPTLRKRNLSDPSPEDFGRVSGHLLAIISNAKRESAIFRRLPEATAKEAKEFCAKLESPLKVLIDEGLNLPPDDAGAFLRGMNFAFSRTFDAATGLPFGWNTNSPILVGICFMWQLIAGKSPSFPVLHGELVKALGENLVGSEDRVKKICHRIGLRFSGDRTLDSKGTAVILDVPSETKMLPDK
jgi:hypothetical protein